MNHFLIRTFQLFFFDNSISKEIKIFSFFIVCLPIALITGPALPDILLSIVALYFLIISILKKQWKYYQNPLVLGFILFCIYSIFRSIFSEFPIESLFNTGSIFYFRYIFFAMGVWYLIDKNKHLLNLLFLVSVLCLLVVSIDGVYQYLVGFNILGFPKHSISRLTGLFKNEPIIGRYLAYMFMLIFALSVQVLKKNKISNFFLIFLISLTGLIIFLSGERTPLFLFVFFLINICCFKNRFQLSIILSFIFLIILILTITSINPIAKIRMITNTLDQISETEIGFLPYNKGYGNHYKAAITLFGDHPIFGIGPDTYDLQCTKKEYDFESECMSHPHSYYFQTLSELGVVGFLFLFSFFISLLFILIKQFIIQFKENKSEKFSLNLIILTIIIFTCIWPIIPHMSLYNNWQNVMIMLPLGFFMKYLYSDRSDGFIK